MHLVLAMENLWNICAVYAYYILIYIFNILRYYGFLKRHLLVGRQLMPVGASWCQLVHKYAS